MKGLDAAPATRPDPPGTRVVIDLRPLQEPERTPITAAYLERLLSAYAAEPLAGESFVVLLRTLRDDPADRLEPLGLAVAGRRRTHLTLRSTNPIGRARIGSPVWQRCKSSARSIAVA